MRRRECRQRLVTSDQILTRLVTARVLLQRNSIVSPDGRLARLSSHTFDGCARLRETSRMTISLAKDVEEFLQEQVRTGAATDATTLVNDVIRSLRAQQTAPLDVTPELEAWLLEAAGKPASPLARSDFDGVRERVRARREDTGA